MKKYKIIILVLFVICVVSVWQNINSSKIQKQNREVAINHIYSKIYDISRTLEDIILEYEKNNLDPNLIEKLSDVKQSFILLDTILTENDKWFSEYIYDFPSNSGFLFLSDTLYVNQKKLSAFAILVTPVLYDEVISENELLYIKRLNDDIKIIIAKMVSTENPPNPNYNITNSELKYILNDFFSKWDIYKSYSIDSPFKLIETK